MIYESELWKEEALKIAVRLERRYNQKRWSERSFFNLEKEIFIGMFSVRKLMESNKVSDSVLKKLVKLSAYPSGNKPITLLNQHKYPELYDLYAGEKEAVTYKDICNQFIHSSIFSPFIPSGKSLVGFFIASDYLKKKKLYYIQLKVVIEILKSVGNNYPIQLNIHFDEKKKDYALRVI